MKKLGFGRLVIYREQYLQQRKDSFCRIMCEVDANTYQEKIDI